MKRLIAKQPLADESKLDLWRNFRAFWRWLKDEGMAENVMADVPAPKVHKVFPRTLEPDQIEILFDSTHSQRDRALIALPLNTSMRLSEIASLTREDVKSDGIQVNGKTGPRILPISPQVRQLLSGLGDGHHIWMGRMGPLTKSGVAQAITRTMMQGGIRPPKVGPHLLRHTFGRLYILNGGDVFSLKRLMGHSDLETTMIYVQMNNRDLIDQHKKGDPLKNVDVLSGIAIKERYETT
ncbi:MAG: tyrosine-type recombinase/integrase [Chloroflexi bacterium]|nr:tyrosine-type recombinase/integrase [Chloroflexota bacterium]